MRTLIGILVVSVSGVLAVAGEPPTKPKPPAGPAVSTKRQAKLDAIHAKRKAVAERKRSAISTQHGNAAPLGQSTGTAEAKVHPNGPAVTIEKQVAANSLQLPLQQQALTDEQAAWNR
jgi:hypothetical protein